MPVPSVLNGKANFHYGLSWRKSPPAIVVDFHPDVAENLPTPPEDFLGLKKDFGFAKFYNDPRDNRFGFDDGAALREGNQFIILIPSFNREDEDFRQKLYEISATFNAIFLTLGFNLKDPTSSPYPQLLGISLITVIGPNGCAVDPSLAPVVREWLENHPNRDQLADEITQVMEQAHRALLPSEDIGSYLYAKFHEENGRPYFSCDSDATDMGVDPMDIQMDGRGFQMKSHNVDSSYHQLLLLAGLVGFHQCIWRDLIVQSGE